MIVGKKGDGVVVSRGVSRDMVVSLGSQKISCFMCICVFATFECCKEATQRGRKPITLIEIENGVVVSHGVWRNVVVVLGRPRRLVVLTRIPCFACVQLCVSDCNGCKGQSHGLKID